MQFESRALAAEAALLEKIAEFDQARRDWEEEREALTRSHQDALLHQEAVATAAAESAEATIAEMRAQVAALEAELDNAHHKRAPAQSPSMPKKSGPTNSAPAAAAKKTPAVPMRRPATSSGTAPSARPKSVAGTPLRPATSSGPASAKRALSPSPSEPALLRRNSVNSVASATSAVALTATTHGNVNSSDDLQPGERWTENRLQAAPSKHEIEAMLAFFETRSITAVAAIFPRMHHAAYLYRAHELLTSELAASNAALAESTARAEELGRRVHSCEDEHAPAVFAALEAEKHDLTARIEELESEKTVVVANLSAAARAEAGAREQVTADLSGQIEQLQTSLAAAQCQCQQLEESAKQHAAAAATARQYAAQRDAAAEVRKHHVCLESEVSATDLRYFRLRWHRSVLNLRLSAP